jgi:hypothetical protein
MDAEPRLTRQHFALYRGWLEGAAIEGLHAAYREPGTDVHFLRAHWSRRRAPRSRWPRAGSATSRRAACCVYRRAVSLLRSCTGGTTRRPRGLSSRATPSELRYGEAELLDPTGPKPRPGSSARQLV